MIELFSADTPNGKKISIMLEEIGYDYKVTKLDLGNKDQFKPEFVDISPFSKIPVITDHDNKESVFEAGAILIYLAEKSGKFYDKVERLKINQWLMAQMGTIGPMIGQHHQFHHYNPGKSKFGEERYFKITKRIYQELENRLKESKFLFSISISPSEGLIKPSIMPIEVVFPHPFGPNKPTVLFFSIWKLILSTAKFFLNILERFLI